jgi:hypothetical protein
MGNGSNCWRKEHGDEVIPFIEWGGETRRQFQFKAPEFLARFNSSVL